MMAAGVEPRKLNIEGTLRSRERGRLSNLIREKTPVGEKQSRLLVLVVSVSMWHHAHRADVP
ncbi:hypothetical protein OK016_03595 [Vibrio chagasii]|nr:hypothetical protein [Vibrio chagasii]